MGTAREIFESLLEEFREAIPEADFGEAAGTMGALRPAGKVQVLGTVAKESVQGDEWSARLAFTAYAPRGKGPGAAGKVLDKMAECVKDRELLAGIERGAEALDKGTGAAAVSCVMSFMRAGSSGGSGGKKVRYPAEIDGAACTVTGWKVTEGGSRKGICAIGEDVPFYYIGSKEYTVELQGLDMEGPEELEGFSLRIGGQRAVYKGCRWKHISSGGSGVLTALERAYLEEE